MTEISVPRLRRAAAGTSSRAPTVIYIAGSGRSGSTLLERVLGELPGVVNVGELIDLFRRTAPRGERCGCGRAFADCPFWHGVGERAFEGWDDDSIAAVCRLQRHVARQRHLPRLLIKPLAGRRFRANVARYGACYAKLYSAISAEAGAAYIVDASKWPVQASACSKGRRGYVAPGTGRRRCAMGDQPEPGRIAARLWRTCHPRAL